MENFYDKSKFKSQLKEGWFAKIKGLIKVTEIWRDSNESIKLFA